MRVFKADQLPARLTAVPAVTRISEEAHDGVHAELVEELRTFDRVQQPDLLVGLERRDALRTRKQLAAFVLCLAESVDVKCALARVERPERTIDEVYDARLARARGAVLWNDLCGQRFDFPSLRLAQSGKRRGLRGAHHVVRMLLRREHSCAERRQSEPLPPRDQIIRHRTSLDQIPRLA